MKLSELQGNTQAAPKLTLSQLQAQAETPQAVTTPKPEKVGGQYAKLVEGLPAEIAQKVIEENTHRGRAADVRSRGAIKKAAEMERLRLQNPYQAEMIEEMNPVQAFAVGAGEGLTNMARGVGLAAPKDEVQAKMDNALRSQNPAAAVGKATAQALPFVAAGGPVANVASKAGRFALGSALGATEGGVIASGEGGSGGQVAVSAALGGVLGIGGEAAVPLANKLGQKIAKMMGKTDGEAAAVKLKDDGTPNPEYEAVLEESGLTPDDVTEIASGNSTDHRLNQVREEAFKELNLPFTEAERTRDKDLWVDQQSLARKTGPVQELVDKREAQLSNLTDRQIEKTGGNAEQASPAIYDAVVGKATQLDDEINSLYQTARDNAPVTKSIRFDDAIASLKENAPSNDVTNGVVKALKSKMEAMGVAKKWKSTGRVDLETSEELRKYANRLYSTANGEGRHVIKQFKDSLDQDVFKGVDANSPGLNLLEQARAAKSKFEADLNPERLNKFDKRKTSLVRDILDNTVSQDTLAEDVVRRSSKYRANDLRELKDYLGKGNEDQIKQGTAAWNDIRAAALTQIKDKAFQGTVSQEGSKRLAPAALKRAMESIGPEKMKVLFSPEERKFLNNLMAVATYKTAPEGTYAPSGPAVEKAMMLINAKIPMIGPLLGDMSAYFKSKKAEKRLMTLTVDADKIKKQNDKIELNKFRRTRTGTTIAGAPVALIAATSPAEED